MRQNLLWCCLWLLTLGAVAQTTAPWGFCLRRVLPEVDVPRVTAAAQHTEMEKDGRRVYLQQVDLAGRLAEPVSAGATLRRTRAHGRTLTNRYSADGWRVWAALCPVMPGENLADPGLFVLVEYLRDNTELQIITPTTASYADPDVISFGGQAAVVLANGLQSGHVRAGLYRVEMFGDSLADVWLLGAGLEVPLTDAFTAEAALTGFTDNYEGRHYDAELALALRYALTERTAVTLAGDYYPRGLPLAGAALSPAAVVGSVYGSSATNRFSNEALATLTLSGSLAW